MIVDKDKLIEKYKRVAAKRNRFYLNYFANKSIE